MKEEKTIDPAFAALVEPEKEQAMEIAPGMTVEEIRAVYFNADALKEPAYRLFQLNSDGHRYYYRFNDAGEPEFYPSVTTLLKQVMPTPPALLDWMIANGKDGSTEKRDLAAAYGTFMHGEFEKLIINRRYDFDSVPAALLAYMERENLPEKVFSEWLPKVRKDVLAFAQFIKDWNVKPLAVEIGLYHPKFHYAGCLDLPCVMTDPKTGKSFTALVDFKSGRKGFYEEHELQLHLYKDAWNCWYESMPITRVFNNTLTIVRGVLDLDKGKISDNILNLSLAELIKTKAAEKDAPEQAAKAPEKTDAPEPATKGRKRAVKATKEPEPINSPSEPEKPVKTENKKKQLIRAGGAPESDRLPWEKDMADGTGIEVEKTDDGVKVTARYFEPAKPAGPTPEQIAEQAAKDNLLNDEIEL